MKAKNSKHDKGQLLLVGGIIFATVILVPTILLNSAIFTQSLSTKGDNINSRSPQTFVSSYEKDKKQILTTVNEREPGSAIDTALTSQITNYTELYSETATTYGGVTNINVKSREAGVKLVQDEQRRNWVDRGGDANWVAVPNAKNYSDYDEQVYEPATIDESGFLSSSGFLDDAYYTEFAYDSVTDRRVYYSQSKETSDALNITVTYDNNTIIDRCEVPSNSSGVVTIDYINGTAEGSTCSALSFFSDRLGGQKHDVNRRRSREIEGKYTIITDTDRSQIPSVNSAYYDESDADSPYATEQIFSFNAQLQYESKRVTLETTQNVTIATKTEP